MSGSITLPDGRKITLPKQETNSEGVVITPSILISTHSVGAAEVIILVKYNGIEKQTGASFHIW